MTENVERVDFGKEKREVARMMGRLLGIVEQQEADIIADPVKYWRMAMARAEALHRHVEAIEEAMRGPGLEVSARLPTRPEPMPQPVMIYREDYDRMQAVEAVVRRGPTDWRTLLADKPEGGA